jgi:checkpoint serine/threonine-protein kinase
MQPQSPFLCQGGRKYQIKGSPGTGAFAKVYKATVDGHAEDMVALKVKMSLLS